MRLALPSSVSFAEGELTKTLTVNCSEQIEMFKAYKIQAIIDEAYTTQYADNVTAFPRAILDIIKEDFKPFAEGTYTSAWTEMGEPATLEFSEIKNCYRFKKATSGLFTYEFSVGEETIDDEESEFNGFYPISYGEDFEDLVTFALSCMRRGCTRDNRASSRVHHRQCRTTVSNR